MPFVYQFCCVDVERKDVPELSQMIDNSHDVTYRTFLRRVPALLKLAKEMGYSLRPSGGLTIKNDYHVHYAKSTWYGKPCYYLVHSAIEYVFMEDTHEVSKVSQGNHATTCLGRGGGTSRVSVTEQSWLAQA